jgi:hypothetical protein
MLYVSTETPAPPARFDSYILSSACAVSCPVEVRAEQHDPGDVGDRL